MKRNYKNPVIATMISLVLLFAMVLPVFAENEDLQTCQEVQEGGINIVLDGEPVNRENGEVNFPEPVIYNGTVYLPVSAIPSLLDINAEYDETTKTLYLGEKPISGYVWVLDRKEVEINDVHYKETYIYSYEGKKDGKEWLLYQFRWQYGEEYCHADVYLGCDEPPAAIKAGGNLSMEMALKVENFGYHKTGSGWDSVPFGQSYIKAGYGYGTALKDQNGADELTPEWLDRDMEEYLTVSGTVPDSETVGDEMNIYFYTDPGAIKWTYKLQYYN